MQNELHCSYGCEAKGMSSSYKMSIEIGRFRPQAFIVICFAILLFAVPAAKVVAQGGTPNFADEYVAGGMTRAASLDWMPDGRVLMAGLQGQVYLVNPSTESQTLYLTVPSVDSANEHGLLDILVDNNFASTGYFYVYYSQAPTSQLHIDRFTFTGNGANDVNSRTVIWTNPGANANVFGRNHIGGSLNIGPDNKFYLSIGDALDSATAQQMTNVFGKILRINKDGSVPTDNPFYSASNPNNIDEIWALGVRNPYRASFDLLTGRYFFGDVGGNQAEQAYEEINIGQRGANYGWANCEGPLGQPKNGPSCPAGTKAPIFSYAHNPGAGCCENAAVTGGSIVRGAQIPTQMQNAYVYADFAAQTARYLTFDGAGNVNGDFPLKDVRFPVWIGQGPDGHIYYIQFNYTNYGELRRLRHTGTANQPPTITSVTASPVSGITPLQVSFNGIATDPENDAISYYWSFGDGSSSTSRSATHTYSAPGLYSATLRVTAGGQSATSSPVQITAGQAPAVAINSPANGSTFIAGQTISLSGSATDDGPLTNNSYVWNVLFVHGNHQHPELNNAVGQSINFEVGDSGHDFSGDTSYLIQLTVTDQLGLPTTRSVEIEPAKIGLQVSASPGVATVVVDDITRSVPFTLETVTNFNHSVSAPGLGCSNNLATVFDSWSDGGAASHNVRAGTVGGSLFATYTQPLTPIDDDLSCTDTPIAQITAPAHGAQTSNAVAQIGIKVAAKDAIANAGYSVRDKSNGQYWNADSASYQASEYFNFAGVIPSRVTLFETVRDFTGAGANGGDYEVRAWAVDVEGKQSAGPRIEFSVARRDTDNDGMADSFEIANGFNPNDPDDASLDADGDGLSNLEESQIPGLDPNNADTDGDSISDGVEVDNQLNPLEPGDCPNWLCHKTPGWRWSVESE